MKIKNKLIGIIIILVAAILIGNFNTLGGLPNSKHNYLNSYSISNDKYLMLVNKDNPLGYNYVPDDLVKPNVRFLNSTSDESKYMDKKAAKALEDLFEGAKDDNITLIGSSAYRSYKSQVMIFNDTIKEKGVGYANKYVAKPGKSEHQSGLAIDVTNESRCMDKSSKEAQWLANNAYRYGFILRYPEGKEDITGYNYEPWHIRYVGKKAAKYIYNNNLTLEECLNK